MRILASTLVLVSAMGFSLLTLVRAAHAAVTCSYNGTDTVTVTLDAAGDSTTLAVESGSDDIQANGSDCGTADTTNTTSVVVTGDDDDDQTFTIDQSEPGGALPDTIDFDVGLAGGAGDTLALNATSGDDAIIFAAASVTIPNAVDFSGLEDVTINGLGGNDNIGGGASDLHPR